jgi:phage protein D
MVAKSYQIELAGAPADSSFYADVVSLTVEESASLPNRLLLQLNTRHQPNGSWSYLGDENLAPFASVSVKLGLATDGATTGSSANGLQPVFDGYITGVNVSLSSVPGDTRIDVTALDTSALMSLEEKIATWPDLSDSQIVEQILQAYGVQSQVTDTSTVHQTTETTVVQRSTDIQFVQHLAQRNGFEFFFETDSSGSVAGYFRPPDLSSTPQPDLAIQFGIDSNLRSFSARVSGQRPLNIKTEQVDVGSNSANSAQVSQSQLTSLGSRNLDSLVGAQLGALVTPKDAQAQMLVLGTPTSDATELHTLAQAVRDEAGWFIVATGEINSEAYAHILRPRRLVLVKGAGTQYSGKYYVTSVIHQMRADGSYTQRFEARRNARDLDNTEQFASGGG